MKKEAKKIKKTEGKPVENPIKKESQESFNFNLEWNKSTITMASILGIIVLLVVFGVIYSKNLSHSEFVYNGIDFEKSYFGKILLYTAKTVLNDSNGKPRIGVSIDFRNDPRKLENIPVNITKLYIIKDRPVYVLSDNSSVGCEDAGLAYINLGRFLANLGLNVKGAQDNPDLAKTNSTIPYVNCRKDFLNTVIVVTGANESSIEQTTANCYYVKFKSCDILKSTEKFELYVLENVIKSN